LSGIPLRGGIHVQAYGGGGSESFVNNQYPCPCPSRLGCSALDCRPRFFPVFAAGSREWSVSLRAPPLFAGGGAIVVLASSGHTRMGENQRRANRW